MQTSDYTIDCTGDCCVGDEIKFERAVFVGSWKKPKFSHNETIRGEIVKESYGRDKQQHTFTIQMLNGEKILIKGRNLYRNGTMRKPWADEQERCEVLAEKHRRGEIARAARFRRKASHDDRCL